MQKRVTRIYRLNTRKVPSTKPGYLTKSIPIVRHILGSSLEPRPSLDWPTASTNLPKPMPRCTICGVYTSDRVFPTNEKYRECYRSDLFVVLSWIKVFDTKESIAIHLQFSHPWRVATQAYKIRGRVIEGWFTSSSIFHLPIPSIWPPAYFSSSPPFS